MNGVTRLRYMNMSALHAMLLIPALLPVAAAAETVGTEADYIRIGQETVTLLRDLTATLEAVSDKETADAAIPRVQEISARLQALQGEAQALPKPGPEQEALFRQQMNTAEVRQAVQQFMGALLKLAQTDAYGSEELISALTNMVSGKM